MKNMPNIPATDTTWMRFAPEMLRERKIRSGISGVRAVASRTRNGGQQHERDGAERERARRRPSRRSAAGSTIV